MDQAIGMLGVTLPAYLRIVRRGDAYILQEQVAGEWRLAYRSTDLDQVIEWSHSL